MFRQGRAHSAHYSPALLTAAHPFSLNILHRAVNRRIQTPFNLSVGVRNFFKVLSHNS